MYMILYYIQHIVLLLLLLLGSKKLEPVDPVGDGVYEHV